MLAPQLYQTISDSNYINDNDDSNYNDAPDIKN